MENLRKWWISHQQQQQQWKKKHMTSNSNCVENWNSNYRHIDFKLELFSPKFKKTWKNASMLLYNFHLVQISFHTDTIEHLLWIWMLTFVLHVSQNWNGYYKKNVISTLYWFYRLWVKCLRWYFSQILHWDIVDFESLSKF